MGMHMGDDTAGDRALEIVKAGPLLALDHLLVLDLPTRQHGLAEAEQVDRIDIILLAGGVATQDDRRPLATVVRRGRGAIRQVVRVKEEVRLLGGDPKRVLDDQRRVVGAEDDIAAVTAPRAQIDVIGTACHRKRVDGTAGEAHVGSVGDDDASVPADDAQVVEEHAFAVLHDEDRPAARARDDRLRTWHKRAPAEVAALECDAGMLDCDCGLEFAWCGKEDVATATCNAGVDGKSHCRIARQVACAKEVYWDHARIMNARIDRWRATDCRRAHRDCRD